MAERVYDTRHVNGTIAEAEHTMDMLVWEETPSTSLQTTELRKRYKDLNNNRGKKAVVYLQTRTEDFEGVQTERDQILLQLVTNGTEEDSYTKLGEAREYLEKQGRERVALYPPEGCQTGSHFRKMVECVFGSSSIKCTVYYKKVERRDKVPGKGRGTDAVMIRRDKGCTYADLLRKVKSKLDNDKEANRTIRNIRGTKEGDLIITTAAGGNSMVNLRKLLSQTGDLRVRNSRGERRKNVTVFLKGMDAVTTKREVAEAVRSETEELPVRVGELRPYFGSCLAVTLAVTQKAAKILTQKREIRIGMNHCRIVEKVEVTQCYRCYGYGHIAAKCQDKNDKSRDCRNCGRDGHIQAKCQSKRRCLLCKKDGHRAGEGTCAALRRALREARMNTRQRQHSESKRAEAAETKEETKEIQKTNGEGSTDETGTDTTDTDGGDQVHNNIQDEDAISRAERNTDNGEPERGKRARRSSTEALLEELIKH